MSYLRRDTLILSKCAKLTHSTAGQYVVPYANFTSSPLVVTYANFTPCSANVLA